MLNRIFCCLIISIFVGRAQQGDKPGEVQNAATFPVPPSPALSPEQALKTFKLAPGFRIELVASEPLVSDPVAMEFDPDGRLWVVEMRGFMPNVDGVGEDAPVGRVVVLEDVDGDGRMDKSTVFLDGLVMPRAIGLVRDGVLVAEPPKLWFCRDTNGDGKCDEKIEVAGDYGNRTSPEHTANGLLGALDNWIYSANYTTRFRNVDGEWKRSPTVFRGQWGLSQDDFGRLFFNSNEDQLRCNLVPSAYLVRNPNFRNPVGLNHQVIRDQAVWPVHANPGVNRGYRPTQLRADGTLATFTAACGPVIYRGDNFPAEFYGNAFVCEPAGNLVKRDILAERDCAITGQGAYAKSEFLASTDERFRPVNACNAPDGTLYLVDMYRGILQHRIFVTSYLRKQIESRGLEKPIGLGRIYRVVHDAKRPGPQPHLSKASSVELVKYLSHPNGWWRDTAQRLLVERADLSVTADLKKLATTGDNPLGRLHALWTLDGMGESDLGTLTTALADHHPKVKAAAIRLLEPFLKSNEKPKVLAALLPLINDDQPDVQLQLAFTFGEVAGARAEDGMIALLQKSADNVLVREAVFSGLVVRELEFLERLLAVRNWSANKPGRNEMLKGLAQCIFTAGKPKGVERVFELAARQSGATTWRQLALLDGMVATAPAPMKSKTSFRIKPINFPAEPKAVIALQESGNPAVRERIEKITSLITWPGQPGYVPPPPVIPLTTEEKERFELGKTLFESSCAQCHQPHGLGQEGLAPPLVDSEWVLGSDQRLARIVLQGVHGPLNVKGRVYELDMPGLGIFDDNQIASILTYIRRAWDHGAPPVEPMTVKKVRAETTGREEAWSESKLLKIP
ncbi:MAG: HEAT repeat domain-containing protein [Verrucomicrobia bacterium]|nr:HEAT repeat domain-containing protein [Verrucomicrobiota bacterium]